MRIGLFDPYLDTLGGGERYILTAASCLSKDHSVFIFWDDQTALKKASKKFNLDLSQVQMTPNIFSPKSTFIKKIFQTNQYDAIIYLSDGSVPYLLARKNIILFQFPVNWVNGRSFVTKLKLKKISKIICYTDFVKQFLDKTFKADIQVVSPPVEQIGNDNVVKENTIVTVGRFTKGMNAKKQEILIETFKKLHDGGLTDWKFVIAGSYLPEDEDFVIKLTKLAKGYPIEIKANVSYDELLTVYKKAKIYWHAAGYGEDLDAHPERAEHFGITTVEAMSAGAVPIVINGGGQKEIVTDGQDGYVWNTPEELLQQTQHIIKDKTKWKEISLHAKKRAEDFSTEKFCRAIHTLL